jgi:membrane protease YdiL (CAAX protease family)
MGQAGSAARSTLPAWLGLPLAVLGFAAMTGVMAPAGRLGIHTALFLAELALIAPSLAALAFLGIPAARGLALHRPARRVVVLALAAGAAFWVASLGLIELQSFIWPPEVGYIEGFRRLHEALRPDGPLELLLSVGAIALMPALCEEIVLRGVVLPSLGVLGTGGAVVVSSVLFAAIHDPYRMPFTFAVGLGLGVLRVRSGTLVPPILAHALLNTITFVAAIFFDDPSQDMLDPRPLLGTALLLAGAGASAFALRSVGRRRAASAAGC